MEKEYDCKNPVQTGVGQITLDWNHPDFGWIPFTADANDVEAHGREIYAAALAGEYGEVRQLSSEEIETEQAERARAERDRLLTALDVVISNPLRWASLSAEQQAEAATYRQALLDVPQQPGFPLDIVWPTVPDFV